MSLATFDQRLDVEALSRKDHMSRRSFDRRFRDLNGSAPSSGLLHQRVVRAQQLLERTDLPIDHVANKVGFSSGVSLRPHFRRIVGVSPQQYRATFRAASPEPDTGRRFDRICRRWCAPIKRRSLPMRRSVSHDRTGNRRLGRSRLG
jgi:AraC-like DNA-binding protein